MSTVNYTMAQYRYTGSGCMAEEKKFETDYANNGSYKDLCFKTVGEAFLPGKYYHAIICLKRNEMYDMKLTLKLANFTNESDAITSFQYLDYVTVPRLNSTVEQEFVPIAYYELGPEDEENPENRKVCIIKDYPKSVGEMAIYNLYKRIENNVTKYYYKDEKGSITECKKYFLTNVYPSWEFSKDSQNQKGYEMFEVTFSPLSTFDCLVVQLERDVAIDPSVTNGTEFGRKVFPYTGNVTDDQGEIVDYIYSKYEMLNDLVEDMKSSGGMSQITKIGVWGKPGTLMCINGEPIKIGPSSFYEQDAVPIESLCMAVGTADWDKNFTIDYIGAVNNKQK